jgi:ABC-type antimicrobial peptide transport system permease subunit
MALARQARQVFDSTDKDVAAEIRPFDDYLAASLVPRRFNALLITIFAGAALLLTLVGIYGVMANLVSQRTREIGIRMALGARRSQVGSLIVLHGLKLVGVGVAVGLAVAFAATRVLANLLFHVSAEDPMTYTMLVLLILVVAVLACCVPAVRAMRVDPVATLR